MCLFLVLSLSPLVKKSMPYKEVALVSIRYLLTRGTLMDLNSTWKICLRLQFQLNSNLPLADHA